MARQFAATSIIGKILNIISYPANHILDRSNGLAIGLGNGDSKPWREVGRSALSKPARDINQKRRALEDHRRIGGPRIKSAKIDLGSGSVDLAVWRLDTAWTVGPLRRGQILLA